jgi:hypothetical protein
MTRRDTGRDPGLTPVKAFGWRSIGRGVACDPMRSRSARGFGAYCAMLAMLFGQVALAAYACASPRPVTPAVMMHAMDTEAGQVPCAAMLSPADAPKANACEVHCNDGLTSPGQPDSPHVTLAALPVPTLALAELGTVSSASRAPRAPLPGAPPPTVRFCRLLI